MAKNDICRISNCKNKITSHGTICGTHRWRKAKFNSYDLPNYNGEPNYPEIKKLPENIVKICDWHGSLKIEQTYLRYHKEKITSYYCKECALDKNIRIKYEGIKGIKGYEELLKKQNGACAMCKGKNNTTRNGKIKRFAIDHDHKTLEVRGLLCSFCNSLLGYAKDSIEILKAAIKYLEETSTGQSVPVNPQPWQNIEQ